MPMRPAIALLCAALLAACQTTNQAPPTAGTFLTPPPALTLSGVPPVPAALAERVGRYTDFRGAGLVDWSPDGARLLVSFREGNVTQLHVADGPGRPLRPITRAPEPTRSGAFLPADADIVVFERDAGGNEATQVYRLDLASGTETRLTEPGRRYDLGPFNAAGTAVLISSVPLDRTAAGGNAERGGALATELALVDPRTQSRRLVATLPGIGWWPLDVAPDDRAALVLRFRSISDSEVWRVDMASGERTRLLPPAGEPPALYASARFAADGRRLFVATDRGTEFRHAYRFDPASGAFEGVTTSIPWDVSGLSVARDRTRLSVVTNEGGRGVARVFDAQSLREIARADRAGANVTSALLAPGGDRLALAVTSSASPSEVEVFDVRAARSAVWAPADTAGIDTSVFQPTEIVQWTSFDGRTVSGLLTRPPKSFAGKRPVLIEVHGGPEAQASIGFNGRYNFLINELGIALLEPNVRGSTGFGKTFHTLDNGMLREDSVKDLGAALDWIARQPDLDASRVVVQGGSYGGYMTLAAAVHYSDRLRGAAPAVGISNFVSFLERTESYRRDLRRAEYGDERDPAMRAFFGRISPLAQADRIRVPLLVLHGRNDPRVPVQEAEQIVATVRSRGVPVWSVIAENEGHGFGKKENADYAFYVRTLFLEKFLLPVR